jgi:hypothetical protein
MCNMKKSQVFPFYILLPKKKHWASLNSNRSVLVRLVFLLREVALRENREHNSKNVIWQ